MRQALCDALDSPNRDLELSPLLNTQGYGIHSGQHSKISLFSANDSSLPITFSAFWRNEVYSSPASYRRLSGTNRSTALVLRSPRDSKKVELSTIEHLMSSLYVRGLPSLVVALDGQSEYQNNKVEVPILDGSALPWELLLNNSSRELTKVNPFKKWYWLVVDSFHYELGSKKISFTPHFGSEFKINCEVNFKGGFHQKEEWNINWLDPEAGRESFCEDIAPARTFALKEEIDFLKKRGLALGGSLDNAIVLDGSEVLNPGGFRLKNELAAHKLLDALGDLALGGAPIVGQVFCREAGHAFHLQALREAIANRALRPAILDESGKFKLTTEIPESLQFI